MRAIATLLFSVLATSQALSREAVDDQPALVREATAVGVAALAFDQGDAASLLDARDRFTAQGWAEFMEKLKGWQDEKGATTFSSRFVPSGPALDVKRHDGLVELTLPGVLEQESRNPYGGVSTSRYRVEVELQFAEATRKVTHLKQHTCGGAGSHPSCR